MRYTRPGEYLLKSIRLISDNNTNQNVEISSLVAEMNIYENMFLNAISARLLITDTNNMLSNFPIIGQETVSIGISSFKQDGSEVFFQHDLKVYNFTSRNVINDNNLSYVLELVSPEQLLNQQRKVCGSFKNKSPTNVAKAILTNKKYGLNLDSRRVDITAGVGTDTVPIKDFIIPNWSPFKALNWLAQNSLSTAGGMDVTVFFYESFSPKPNETHIRSKFNFKSFAEMFRDKSEEIYTYYPTEDSSDRRGMSQKEIENIDDHSSHNRITSYIVEQPYNIIKNINMGMYSSRVIGHDIIERSLIEQKFSYGDDVFPRMRSQREKYKYDLIDDGLSEKYSNYKESSNSKVYYVPINHDQRRGNLDYIIPTRNSVLQRFDNIRLTVTISGNLERSIGDVITLKIPSSDSTRSISGKESEDNLYSGDYAITAIRHKFTPATYEMILNVTKDNYFKTLSSIREGK
tara:strand:- start:1105 stop:2487 length:1383 start_codon:yes stop_codon:yes gene_type:complete